MTTLDTPLPDAPLPDTPAPTADIELTPLPELTLDQRRVLVQRLIVKTSTGQLHLPELIEAIATDNLLPLLYAEREQYLLDIEKGIADLLASRQGLLNQ